MSTRENKRLIARAPFKNLKENDVLNVYIALGKLKAFFMIMVLMSYTYTRYIKWISHVCR